MSAKQEQESEITLLETLANLNRFVTGEQGLPWDATDKITDIRFIRDVIHIVTYKAIWQFNPVAGEAGEIRLLIYL